MSTLTHKFTVPQAVTMKSPMMQKSTGLYQENNTSVLPMFLNKILSDSWIKDIKLHSIKMWSNV
jgi:hypothetical protein